MLPQNNCVKVKAINSAKKDASRSSPTTEDKHVSFMQQFNSPS